MLMLSGMAFITAVFVLISKAIHGKRKLFLVMMELGAALLLMSERLTYIYDGARGLSGYFIIRTVNFLVFFLIIFILFSVNLYFEEQLITDGGMGKIPVTLRIADALAWISGVLIIMSQFTGLYYSFDENNVYVRSPFYFISYIFPYLILMLQLYAIIRYGNKLRRSISASIVVFACGCLLASLIQLFAYGISLIDITVVLTVICIYVFSLLDLNEKVEEANRLTIHHLEEERKSLKSLFEQTATAIVTAIDAKDRFTQGHSIRVAEYAREIARMSEKGENECDEVYYAGLLHDVGKIGVSDDIIKKASSLTEEESEAVREHTEIGREILSTISDFPYLSTGAAYHHERWDGRGYPDGLKGEEIPEIARIIAVADTYDAMTSKRQYREPLPQQTVKEEIVKGSGTQFDPEYASIMVKLIDRDREYNMREKNDGEVSEDVNDLTKVKEMIFYAYKENVSDGLLLGPNITTLSFRSEAEEGFEKRMSVPSLILFDSNDGCVHKDERSIRNLKYIEYGEIWPDGHTVSTAARDIKTTVLENPDAGGCGNPGEEEYAESRADEYRISAVRIKDHVRVRFKYGNRESDVIAALPDSVHYAYIALTGEHCTVSGIETSVSPDAVGEDYIPRIAEEISYIKRPEGDIPNIQVDGYRSASTRGIPVVNGMRISFHAMSLPTADLVWHCPFINLFYSGDRLVEGKDYREFALIRIDGGDGTNKGVAENNLIAVKEPEFQGWDAWKEACKKGFDCIVTFKRRRNKITMSTGNFGISIKNVTIITDGTREVYVSLTGDQCAITDIRIM